MRIDYEDLQQYAGLVHIPLEKLIEDYHINSINYYNQVGEEDIWFYKSSPYLIYDILRTRDTGLYEIWYDYIKRRIERRCSVFDFGAGIGTLEVILLKRYPAAITVEEPNLLCLDFVHWRALKRGFTFSPFLDHYDYVVSLDTIQRLPTDSMRPTFEWLLGLGDQCFIYANPDSRHPLYNEIPFDMEEYAIRLGCNVENFHGLLNIEVVPHEE